MTARVLVAKRRRSRNAFARPQSAGKFVVEGAAGSVSITVSIGFAEWRKKWDSAELYRRSDRALYLSKSSSRNRVTQDAA